MQMQTYEQRVLIPDTNKWLYNAIDNVVSDKVYLGKDADASLWVEITEEEKQKIEASMVEDTEVLDKQTNVK